MVMVMEATGRTGGRVHTVYQAFKTQISIEAGGEFIDNNHDSILDLCRIFLDSPS
jgi:monoamine oxidase